MTDDIYPSFENLCRLCLRQGTATVDIFSNNICGSNKEPSVPVRIMACAALEVLPTDGLPKSVCTECRYQLEKSYYFRKRCQLSDKKLRKHQRLLSLGKKSKVFSRTEDEDFEDELEFEDSRNFLDEKDSERQRQEQERNDCWKVWTKEILREEVIREYKQQLMSECKDQIRAEVEEELMDEMFMRAQEEIRPKLKKEVREEVKAELREEVTQSIRESLKSEMRKECIAQAMVELRTECRKEERENLLNDLRDFLCLKHNNNGKSSENVEKSVKSNDSVVNLNVVAAVSQENEAKLEASPFINKKRSLSNSPTPLRTTQKLKFSVEKDSNSSDNEITSTEQTISFIAITNDHQPTEAAESNFLILENEERENEDEENLLYSYSDEDEFRITPSECSDNCNATYQIEASGEVKFFKKELRGMDNNSETASGGDPAAEEEDIDKNILIFDPQVEQDDSLEKVEFVSMEKKSGSSGKKNVVQPNKVITSFPKEISISTQNSATVMLNSKDIVKTFQCSQCPRAFTTENSMRRHMSVHRILEKKGVIYKCSDCQIIVSCKSALNRHMLKHSGERPYVCDECGKSFIQREILKRHILAHAGARPYGCPHCDRSFSQKLNLTQHVNKFHTENPKIQQYPCHLCPKRFNHASGLSRHLIKHSGVAYQCTECDRTFTDRSSVKRHIVHLHGGNGIDRIETMSINEEISKGDRICLNQNYTGIQQER